MQVLEFQQDQMRQHLAQCFDRKQFTPFPHTIRSIPYIQRYFTAAEIEVFCTCELPDVYDANMIQCDSCGGWFHLRCVEVSKKVPEVQVTSS